MRAMWCVLAGAMSFAVCQASGATTLTLTGTGGTAVNVGSESVYVYPYDFSVNGSSSTTQLMCLNFNDEITQGESWSVNVENINQAPTAALLNAYEKDAWLYSQITPATTQDQQTLIQFAVWDILDPSGVEASSNPYWNANSVAIQNLEMAASSAIAGESADFFNQFAIYVPDHDSSYYTSANGYPYGVPQSFVGVAATPEPGSLALLGTGLLGIGGVLRRKMRKK